MASLNFDGAMRTDANHAGNAQYAPNSFKHKFRPDAAETPYAVSDNIVSRKSHYYHEGKDSDYDQARELYSRVMTPDARAHLHKNTATMLSMVSEPIIQQRYLAQIWNIAPEYSSSVYNGLAKKEFEWLEVEQLAKKAAAIAKEPKFRPGPGDRLVGKVPEVMVYGA